MSSISTINSFLKYTLKLFDFKEGHLKIEKSLELNMHWPTTIYIKKSLRKSIRKIWIIEN